MTDPLPEDVRRFLEENIESIEQLEILRLLGEDPDREWSAGELAVAIQADPAAAAGHVAALGGRGLLTLSARDGGPAARHGGRTPAIAARAAAALAAYHERPVTTIRFVYARAGERLRAFADAFRIRKED